jgi:hypothetical protein
MSKAKRFVYAVGAYQVGISFYLFGKSFYNFNDDEN